MQAVVLREFGGPEMLRSEEVPTPIPGPGEVLVQVHAVSVNRTLGSYRCARQRRPTDSWRRTNGVARSSWIRP